MISMDEIVGVLGDHCIVTPDDISKLPRGHIRIGTKLVYPDGSGIDLFVDMSRRGREHGYTLSDFGRTLAKLAEYQMKFKVPNTREQTIIDMAAPFKVEVVNDRLVIAVDGPEYLGDGLIRLGQACISVASLIYSRRIKRQTTLDEELKSVIGKTGLRYTEKFSHPGPYVKQIQVDYRVEGPSKNSSILTIGPHHYQATDVFTKWSNLRHANVADQFLTIFDDRSGKNKPDDLASLERFSEVISIKNVQTHEMLA